MRSNIFSTTGRAKYRAKSTKKTKVTQNDIPRHFLVLELIPCLILFTHLDSDYHLRSEFKIWKVERHIVRLIFITHSASSKCHGTNRLRRLFVRKLRRVAFFSPWSHSVVSVMSPPRQGRPGNVGPFSSNILRSRSVNLIDKLRRVN